MSWIPHPNRSGWLCVILLSALLVSCTPGQVRESDRQLPTVVAPSPSIEPSPENSQIRARISLPRGAQSIAFGNRSIWLSISGEQSISRIDLETREISGPSIALDFEPREIAYGEGGVWALSADRTRLARIDPETKEVIAVIDLSALRIPTFNLVLVAAGEGAVWITDQTAVIQIDPQTNQIVGGPIPAGEEIIAVAVGHGTFWTGSHDDGIVTRVDSRTNHIVAKIEMGFSVHGLAVDEESAWVLDEHGSAVARIDPQTNQLGERIPINFVAANLEAGGGAIWVAPAARDSGRSTGNDGIARIDAHEKRVEEIIHVGDVATSEYYAIFFHEGSVWVLIVTPQMSIVQIAP